MVSLLMSLKYVYILEFHMQLQKSNLLIKQILEMKVIPPFTYPKIKHPISQVVSIFIFIFLIKTLSVYCLIYKHMMVLEEVCIVKKKSN